MITRLFPALLVIAAVGLFLGYIQPTFTGDIASLKADITNYDAALASAERFKQKEVALTAEQAQISPEGLARLDTFLPDSVDNVQLILDLNSLASRSGVQLSDFDIAEDTSQAGPVTEAPALSGEPAYDHLDLSVSAIGSYPALRTFLAGVEGSLRPLDVMEVKVTDSPTGVYTYDLTFRLYWLR